MKKFNNKTFQGLILNLQKYWEKHGCAIIQPLDIEVGAATFHPMTCLNVLESKPVYFAYVQSCRRPSDGRYGSNKTNRLQKYYQFQVVIKPSPNNFQNLYLNSLEFIDINLKNNDIKFVEDNWENKTIGACGVGWEIWLNGIEVTQLTYFQQMCGIKCRPITAEITYGLERLSMHVQNVDNIYDIIWQDNKKNCITYGSLYKKSELEQSIYNFEYTDINSLFKLFESYEKKVYKLLEFSIPLIMPAYEFLLKLTHLFNIIDARKAISVSERQKYILRIRNLTKIIANYYFNSRK